MMKKILLALLATTLFAACTQEDGFTPSETASDHITVNATMQNFVPADGNRTIINPTNYSCTWKSGDKIGMFSHKIEGETQTPSQLGLSLYTEGGTGQAVFTGTTGWLMNPTNYNYIAYYPYKESNTKETIELDYIGQTQTENNSTAHLGDYDFMYSTLTTPTSAESASFSFSHINALAKFIITIPEEYRNRKYCKMRIIAEEDIFVTKAKYGIASIITNNEPTIDATEHSKVLDLDFTDDGISVENGTITAYMMMMPSALNKKELTLKLYEDLSRIPLLEGTFTPSADQTAATVYTYSIATEKSQQLLPDKPKQGEQLHILLFGHSFGEDCMTYLPDITKAAGITDVHYGRFYQGNCSMTQHYGHWTGPSTNVYKYYNSPAGSGTWSYSDRNSKEVVAETPWDIIIFQTNIGFPGEGNYDSYKNDLRDMVTEVVSMCKGKHHKTPLIGWNMFWGFPYDYYKENEGKDLDPALMYNAIVGATQEMQKDNTDVRLVIPTGTAVQNVRGTSLHNKTCMLQLTRDGYHMGFGFGRYVTACTWFQTIIAPIYGIDIEASSSYIPTDFTTYTKDEQGQPLVTDKVTEANRPILWKCARAAALNPFEVTHIDE